VLLSIWVGGGAGGHPTTDRVTHELGISANPVPVSRWVVGGFRETSAPKSGKFHYASSAYITYLINLFMLVSALMGLERMRAAYAHAIDNGYRFYSYGDASLLLPSSDRATG
jgi:hypothetical protein